VQHIPPVPERFQPRFPEISPEEYVFTPRGEEFVKACRAPGKYKP
jgi:hypothetical protein